MNKILAGIKGTLVTGLSAFLGAWAGAEGTSKNWRRFLIPFALSGLAYGHLKDWRTILIMAMMGAFSMGYGIPDPADKGSALGRFWYNLFSFADMTRRKFFTNVFTRGTVGFMVGLSLICIPIIKGNWITYILCCQTIKMAYGLLSWRDMGGIWVKGKYLLMVDIITYGTIGLATTIMIYF